MDAAVYVIFIFYGYFICKVFFRFYYPIMFMFFDSPISLSWLKKCIDSSGILPTFFDQSLDTAWKNNHYRHFPLSCHKLIDTFSAQTEVEQDLFTFDFVLQHFHIKTRTMSYTDQYCAQYTYKLDLAVKVHVTWFTLHVTWLSHFVHDMVCYSRFVRNLISVSCTTDVLMIHFQFQFLFYMTAYIPFPHHCLLVPCNDVLSAYSVVTRKYIFKSED